jgi:enolase
MQQSSPKIKQIEAREILDSRGNPTLKISVLAGSKKGEFAVPAGTSTGAHEALELRDNNPNRFGGLGVQKAIEKISQHISPALQGVDITKQKEIDAILKEIDNTPNKSFLGGNTTIGVSIACAKAAARVLSLETFEYLKSLAEIKPSRKTPLLYFNLINGGKHSQSNLDFQEYLIVPMTDNIEESLETAHKIQRTLKEILVKKLGPLSANLGDEGGFAPNLSAARAPLELLSEAIKKNGLKEKVRLALDTAASSFYKNGNYVIETEKLNSEKLLEFYNLLIKEFSMFSIEDPFFEEDFKSFAELLRQNPKLLVIGDDLTVTNRQRLQAALKQKSINGIIIKPNQIGTLSETLETMNLARSSQVECIVSHRSGETNDDFIADLAFAFGCFGLKAGALQRGERIAKYNRIKILSNNC